ncbi:MAG: PEP-CTERM sorting domain-containing protein [Alphaproteobacteria bacterium]|nr:PEP-CTERM sorting domain-containing protein [Alphaproteobacteria bacterium]
MAVVGTDGEEAKMTRIEKTRKRAKRAPQALRRHLALSTALASMAFVGYGARGAYAGSCVLNGGTYECSGAAGVDLTQSLNGAPLNVTTDPGFGITTAADNAFALTGTGGLTFTDTNGSAITGQSSGIYAENTDGGALTVTTTGAVIGVDFQGIDARNDYFGTDLTISAATLNGGGYGINARNYGSGVTSFTASGQVTGTSGAGVEIAGYGTSMTVSAQGVSGGTYGIFANNEGDSGLTVTANGPVAGGSNAGIYARNADTATDLTIDADAVSGGGDGIRARNLGSGLTDTTATGPVVGISGYGINAYNADTTTGLTISAAAVTGDDYGIKANHQGTGALNITASGPVGATNDAGIEAYNTEDGTGVTVSAADVDGRTFGIRARNEGGGALSVTANGPVTGSLRAGIFARNNDVNYGTDLTVSASSVSGGENGIDAVNSGTGFLSITASGLVAGGENGIFAFNESDGDLTVSAASVSGGTNGIYAFNEGDGDLTVSAAAVSGGTNGIYAFDTGEGALNITASGPVTGSGGDGIYASNYGDNMTISVVNVTGEGEGIEARKSGGGAMSITAAGQVTGSGGDGIFAENSGTDLSISAVGVSGLAHGIFGVNYGTENFNINAAGPVSGTNLHGLYARNEGTDLSISAAEVSGGSSGIVGINDGTGDLNITATGGVTGSTGDGIHAINLTGSANLTVDVNAVSGQYYGILANNEGNGALSVTAAGPVTGTVRDGIFAYNSGNGTSLTVSTDNAVGGGRYGINAENLGSGPMSITATGGPVTGGLFGILAQNTGSDLTIAATDVSAVQNNAIGARNQGPGVLSVTVDGAITGGTFGAGIYTRTDAGSMSVITLNSGASVSSAYGLAIRNNYGDSATTVNTGDSVAGRIELGDGSDNLTFDGGNFSGVTTFDGGDDTSNADGFTDRLEFRNVTGNLDGSSAINWEVVTVGAGGVVTLSNTLTAENVTVASGGSLGGTGTVAGSLTVESGGTLGPGASAGDFSVDGNLTLDGGGNLEFEFFTPLSFDTLDVTGGVGFGFGGEIDLLFDAGFDPFDGLSLTFLTSGGIGGFGNLLFDFIGLDPLFTAVVGLGPQEDTLFVTFSGQGGPTSVPEPGMLTLFGAGLLGLFGLGWRRRCPSRGSLRRLASAPGPS